MYDIPHQHHQWGWQVTHSGQLPDPRQLCNNEPDKPQCTPQRTSRDSGFWGGPHVNWFPATYEGTIFWDGHSAPGTDDDYNFRLQRADKAGLTVGDARGLQLEFDADETIDHFHTPWWNDFHSAVDSNDASARQRVDGKFAIVTGLVGLDCEHSCGAEVHPVHALAIRVKEDPADEVWAIFVRNWGNEGFCSANQHFLPLTSFTFRLPWRPGVSAVNVRRFDRDFLVNDSNASGPNVTSAVHEGVLVHFTLSPAREDGTRINGELHLQWSGSQIQPVQLLPQAVFAVLSAQPEEEENAEHRLGDLLAQMTPQQRETFLTTLPKKTISYDEIAPLPSEARAVPQLPVLLQVQPSQPLRVQAGNAVEKAARERRVLDAWCKAFDGNVPGFPHACKDRCRRCSVYSYWLSGQSPHVGQLLRKISYVPVIAMTPPYLALI